MTHPLLRMTHPLLRLGDTTLRGWQSKPVEFGEPLTTTQVARLLDLSVSTLHRWITDHLPHVDPERHLPGTGKRSKWYPYEVHQLQIVTVLVGLGWDVRAAARIVDTEPIQVVNEHLWWVWNDGVMFIQVCAKPVV